MEKKRAYEEAPCNGAALPHWTRAIVDVLPNDRMNAFHASWKSVFTRHSPLSLSVQMCMLEGSDKLELARHAKPRRIIDALVTPVPRTSSCYHFPLN